MTATIETPAAGQDDRTPPHDLEAEQALLGAMLLSQDAIDAVGQMIKSGDFYFPRHGTIFDSIINLYGKGGTPDTVTVAHALRESGDLIRVGGAPYLHTLIAGVPSAANVGHYAKIMAECSTQRKMIEAGIRITQLGYSATRVPGKTLGDMVDLAQQTVYDITGRQGNDDFASLAEMLQPTLDDIEAAGSKDALQTGVPTGFIDLDRLLNGFHPGQLIIVAGRPGLGKSTAALDFARNAAIRAKQTVGIFSLEMSKVEIITRLLSAESRVPLHVLRNGQLSDDDWTKLARCMGDIAEAPLFVDDTAATSLMEIRSKARRLKQRHDLRMIVVDYLQLVSSPQRTESRQQEVSDLSRGLKLLAKEVGCPVIAVCQLNRGPEQRADKRPQLSDLRESGSLEQDADVVILLHRDDYYDKESARAGEADFIVAKHRNGPTDTVTVAAQLHLARFADLAIV
ncbi:primary replicative DNA helicase [Micromonospora pisi]|uniref:Replicative DNA helicase n=1 Tax=Micromonospora pisi TaxID=589240 RepID=A0A495JUZ9_9ACTN|nr:replicative DNA helicase [Micromonospora pisi]RKR92820.1 primary replicative DNA helicase [Micromonospora pisi]